MKDGKSRPWYVPVLAVLILSTVMLSKNTANQNLVLIPVVLAFALGFGILIAAAVKEWKKSDEEVLAGFSELAGFFSGSGKISMPDRKKQFLGALGVAVFAVVRTEASGPSLVFLALALALFGIPFLLTQKGRQEKKERLVKPEAIIALILGLLTCGFFCFFVGIGVYHGAWWFVLPPGLCFLSFFSRPLVAAVRTLLNVPRLRRDKGEGHVRRGKEMDPWDRPDRDQSAYNRKK